MRLLIVYFTATGLIFPVNYFYSRMRGKRNAYRILVGKPEGKRPLGRPRRIVLCVVFLLLPFLLEHRASVIHRFTSVS
jgi:hypothetical protein